MLRPRRSDTTAVLIVTILTTGRPTRPSSGRPSRCSRVTRWRQSEQGASAQPSVGGVGVAGAASRRWFPASDPASADAWRAAKQARGATTFSLVSASCSRCWAEASGPNTGWLHLFREVGVGRCEVRDRGGDVCGTGKVGGAAQRGRGRPVRVGGRWGATVVSVGLASPFGHTRWAER